MWTSEDLAGRSGIIHRWVLRSLPFGPVWLNYHAGCCQEAPQKTWLLTVEGLGIRDDALTLAKSADEAKAEALTRIRFKLDVIRAQIVKLAEGGA